MQQGNTVTIRWRPARVGVDGNEIADPWVKTAAGSAVYVVKKPLLEEAGLAYIPRSITEAKSRDTAKWIDTHVKRERRYGPSRGRRMRQQLWGKRKAWASRHYQFLSSHAAIRSYSYLYDRTHVPVLLGRQRRAAVPIPFGG